jgi:peptidyl-prolyl cis-trans isomerase SurA
MIEVDELMTPRQAMDRIIEIQGKLEDGEDFTELAKEYSDDATSANLGGDMGWFPPEAYGERVHQTLLALAPGQVSEPFQTLNGWHVMELLDTRERDRTEEAIRAEARDKIRMQRAEQEIEKVLRQFRDESFVEIRLPGQTQGSG